MAPFTGFAQEAGVELARLQALLADNGVDSAHTEVALGTITAFRQVQAAMLQIETLTSAAGRAQLQLDQTQALERQGMATKVDVLSLSIARLDYDQKLIEAKVGLADAHERLKSLTGKEIEVPAPLEEEPKVGLPPLQAEGLSQIKALAIQRDILETNRTLARSKLYPTVALTGAFHYGMPGLDQTEEQWMAYGTAGVLGDLGLRLGGGFPARSRPPSATWSGSRATRSRRGRGSSSTTTARFGTTARPERPSRCSGPPSTSRAPRWASSNRSTGRAWPRPRISTTPISSSTRAELDYRTQLLSMMLKASQIDALSGEIPRPMERRAMKISLRSVVPTAAVPAAILLAAVALGVSSCAGKQDPFAYTGRMDVDTVTVSAQAAGVLESLTVKEGDPLRKDEALGSIDTDRLQAQRQQQEAQIGELEAKRIAAEAQIQQADAQLALSRDTLAKTEKVLAEGGATQQRRDELATETSVGEKNLAALQANFKMLAAQEDEMRAGIRITDIAIRDAKIVSPLDGVVLDKFHYQGELVAVGTPLLEVADLSELTVEIYVPLDRLGSMALGAKASGDGRRGQGSHGRDRELDRERGGVHPQDHSHRGDAHDPRLWREDQGPQPAGNTEDRDAGRREVLMDPIVVSSLRKSYGAVEAVRGVSFAVGKGSIFGLIGPDGGGKTTIMRSVVSLLSMDSGEMRFMGRRVDEEPDYVRSRIGYMPQRFSLYQDLTVEENLRFFGDLFAVPRRELERRLERLYAFSGLAPFKARRAAALSGGMKQKLALVVHAGPRPRGDRSRRAHLRRRPGFAQRVLDHPGLAQDREGTTVLVSTAYMDEALLCDGWPSSTRARSSRATSPQPLARVSASAVPRGDGIASSRLRRAPRDGALRRCNLFGEGVHLTLAPGVGADEVERALRERDVKLRALRPIEPGLEDLFLRLMKE